MILADTTILVRAVNLDDPLYTAAAEALEALVARGRVLVIAPQNIMEFWAVATRPKEARGGLGLSQQLTRAEVAGFARTFRLLPETRQVFAEWVRLAEQCAVAGKQVHDARLAAWMRVHGISEILTFNVDDFRRYPGITPVDPREVAPEGPLREDGV